MRMMILDACLTGRLRRPLPAAAGGGGAVAAGGGGAAAAPMQPAAHADEGFFMLQPPPARMPLVRGEIHVDVTDIEAAEQAAILETIAADFRRAKAAIAIDLSLSQPQ